MSITGLSPAAIALNRFGLGAKPSEAPPTDARRWLTAQFDRFDARPAVFVALPDAGAMVKSYREQQQAMRQAARLAPTADTVPTKPAKTAEQMAVRQDFAQDVQALYRQAVQARTQSALETQAPFIERMVHFWSNHFCVSADNPQTSAFVGAFERDAIRPHVLGRFEDMLLAVEQHPAMLIYLNQIQSIGPDSLAARRAAARSPGKVRGLNENLGREVMELHTLGVRSGYTQADVTEFARALTGWSVGAQGPQDDGNADDFAFRPNLHEPGPRTILGKTYDQAGVEQARAVLIDFARSPATATHVATKLARHFAGDMPPPALVARLTATFTKSRGDLPSLYRTLIESAEGWAPTPLKFKTPWEWTVSALRGLGREQVGQLQMAGVQSQLGQPLWKPGSPAGWDDTAASWAAPDALLRRVEFAQRLVAPIGDTIDARVLGPKLIPASFSPATAEQVSRAESPGSALALLLISPDFLRR
ncbi:DUF1800 domain-containing protein [Sphingomonas sp. CGMCC 1.13654]|uniref:DUF1800 domain-containing protein n=1 Tax=Sphingomonas chungangi TaxID=2683589 RepID=A0A838LBD0_9SPHN|nr:DUF1800 domain-containing protein [Sphingomonas chungangi]MBA2936524.1 DUF1800 domain-containing protein [Sphingomonas chungangi]MVW55909.1 DUF1800 family protein [Sphingomonas chungangi]